jgi:5-methylthioribose kinase
MLELTPDNTAGYLRSRGWLPSQLAEVEALTWGVSNAVLRVTTPASRFVVKQSRPRLRTREDWFSDIGRIFREVAVMQLLRPFFPPGLVPRVLFVDRENYAFGMEHAPPDAQVWKQQLLEGITDVMVARHAGEVLGQIHQRTSEVMDGAPSDLADLNDKTVFVQLRVEPFYQRIRQRRPEIARFVEPLIDQLLSIREALCHGDYSPKNILVHSPLSFGGRAVGSEGEAAFTLVDYETGHFGDPAMDLGFFLSHLLLKAVRAAPGHEPYLELTTALWSGYGPLVRFRPLDALVARGIQHCAVCMLARIDGTSPVDYLPDEGQRESVRRIGRQLLQDQPPHWPDVLDIFKTTV